MIPVRRFLIASLALLIALAGLSGCGPSVEQNPAFTKLAKRVKDLEDSKANMAKNIDDLSLDVKTAMGDITNIEASVQGAGSPKTEEMEKQLADVAQRLQTIEAKLQNMKPSKAAAKETAAIEPADGGVAADEIVADSAVDAKPAKQVRSKAARPKAAAVRTAPAAGFYYSVKKDESLEDVAIANGLSADALAQANHLPATAKVYPGQPIFVPKQ